MNNDGKITCSWWVTNRKGAEPSELVTALTGHVQTPINLFGSAEARSEALAINVSVE